MSKDNTTPDPMEFMRSMWTKMGFNIPGIVTPTLDVEELDKRISDMKTVETWLKMNLSSLQMAIQGLEMQRTTIATMQAMSKMATEGAKSAEEATGNPFTNGMWPWNMMQNAAEQAAAAAQAATPPAPEGGKGKAAA